MNSFVLYNHGLNFKGKIFDPWIKKQPSDITTEGPRHPRRKTSKLEKYMSIHNKKRYALRVSKSIEQSLFFFKELYVKKSIKCFRKDMQYSDRIFCFFSKANILLLLSYKHILLETYFNDLQL
jgi:hypothetical protein